MAESKAIGRTQLKGVLDNLVQKSIEQREDTVDADVQEGARGLLELTDESGKSRKRKQGKVGAKRKRKRMRKESVTSKKLNPDGLDIPNGARHIPHVMTLFDRKVDLAKFSPDTSLYVMCREWMSNNPDNHTSHVTPSHDNALTSHTILPSPTPLPTDKDGREVCIDIPKPHPPISNGREDMDKRIKEATSDLAIDLSECTKEHLRRWKEVRERWRVASAQNQLRYKDSLKVLKGMFHRL